MTRYSEVSYTYSGGSKVFTIPFSYLKTEHINVFIDDVEATDFEFNTTSQIQVNDEITSGQVVKITRTTPIDSRMVNFNDRSVLNAQQQNLDSNQLFNVVQEVYDRNDNFIEDIQTQVDTANTNASAAVSTANTANLKADTAISTANAAETKADNAVSTANSANLTANTASTNATNAVNTANSASSTANAASNKVDEFGQSIATVVEAASKINQLEQSVTTAINAATTATNKASEATTAAQTATSKAQEAATSASAATGKVGDLEDLTTTAKNTVVDAVNEVKASIPTNLSSFNDDLGSNPVHTHIQYVDRPMTTLATEGTITLVDNSRNKVTPTGDITFVLPTVTDLTKFHEILVQINQTTVVTFDLGLGLNPTYFNETAPDLSAVGIYDIIYEYDNDNDCWVCGAVTKGGAS